MKAKTIILAGMAFAGTVLGGCVTEPDFEAEKGAEKPFNTFDFSTVDPDANLEVAYSNTEVKARIYFEIYDQMPIVETEHSYDMLPDVTPLFAAFTDKDGVFKANVELPAYLKKVYIYTPAFYARTLIEADVVNGAIHATDAVEAAAEAETRAISSTQRAHDSYMVTTRNTPSEYRGARWKTWLGSYDKHRNGAIEYEYTSTGENDELIVKDYSELYEAHTKVIGNRNSDVCPDMYRRYTDLLVDEEAELAVTFLGQNTCWNCSLGYYYYQDGQTPKSLDDVNVIMLFPNTQDGGWHQGSQSYASQVMHSAGINRGTVAQLKYYPDNDRAQETTKFPAGTRIGFVLANNAWSNRTKGFNWDKGYRAATSEGLSVNNDGVPYNRPRTAAYQFDGRVMISFEDHTDDENFSDVVITMSSNPVEAITDIPVVDPDDENQTVTVKLLRGIYAFEDLWPAAGDYDMNDVIVRANCEKTFASDNSNALLSESFIFKTFQNYAALKNGLALRVTPAGQVANRKYYIRRADESEFSEVDFTMESDNGAEVYLLTDDVHKDMGAEYKVTLEYAKPVTGESKAEPFVFRTSTHNADKRWEVHLPQTKPTSKMDYAYFDRIGSDASDPEKGIYYVREGLYPFAIFLSGADEDDVKPLLDGANEKKPIDTLYPSYDEWVRSGGTINADWYKK